MSVAHDRMHGEVAVAIEIWFRQMEPWPTWHADAIARPHGTDVNPHVYMPQRAPAWAPMTRYVITDRVNVAGVELWCSMEGVSGEHPPTVDDGGRAFDGSCIWIDSVAPRAMCPCSAYRAPVVVNGREADLLVANDPRAAEMNQASLQHAIAAASGGGTVKLPVGQFHLVGPFQVGPDVHGVTITGAGATGSRFVLHDAESSFLIDAGARDVDIRSLGVTHAKPAMSAAVAHIGSRPPKKRAPPRR